MFNPGSSVPLTRRLNGNYLLFGSACMICLCWTLFLSGGGELGSFGLMAVAVLLLILLLGSKLMQRTLRFTSEIEQQLRKVSASPSTVFPQPIDGDGPVISGWNQIVHQTANSQSMEGLEARLNRSLDGLKLQKSEQILNSLPDGVAVTDPQGLITFINQSLSALLNMEVGEDRLNGRPMEELLSIETARDSENIQQQTRQHSRPVVFELQQADEASTGVLRVARYPLCAEAGKPMTHIWSVRDVTQQKLAEQMRNQFVHTATHELRTPLANIKAYAETLALNDDIDVERQKEFCNTINSEATRLARFVDDLLDISQMEAGSLSLLRHETDLERLLSEVAEKIRPQMVQKRIDFEVLVPPKLPKLNLDKDKIAAALVNLLGNAVKYTAEEGRVQLQVEADFQEIQLHVEDTGIGISHDDLPNVFDKFFRSDDSRVRDVSGSGLGLSFSQEIVRFHGGKLTVHSELNKGTKFTMILPIS